jgi:hypothetical protein
MAHKYYWLEFKNAEGEWEIEQGYMTRGEALDEQYHLIGTRAPWIQPRGWLRKVDVRVKTDVIDDEAWEDYLDTGRFHLDAPKYTIPRYIEDRGDAGRTWKRRKEIGKIKKTKKREESPFEDAVYKWFTGIETQREGSR